MTTPNSTPLGWRGLHQTTHRDAEGIRDRSLAASSLIALEVAGIAPASPNISPSRAAASFRLLQRSRSRLPRPRARRVRTRPGNSKDIQVAQAPSRRSPTAPPTSREIPIPAQRLRRLRLELRLRHPRNSPTAAPTCALRPRLHRADHPTNLPPRPRQRAAEQAKSQRILLEDARRCTVISRTAAACPRTRHGPATRSIASQQRTRRRRRILEVTRRRRKENLELPVEVTRSQLHESSTITTTPPPAPKAAGTNSTKSSSATQCDLHGRKLRSKSLPEEDLPKTKPKQDGAILVAMAIRNNATVEARRLRRFRAKQIPPNRRKARLLHPTTRTRLHLQPARQIQQLVTGNAKGRSVTTTSMPGVQSG